MAGTGFTTCSHEEPHFQIKTNKSKVVLGERIITGPAHFEFFGIPTPLVIPYGYFPTNLEKPSISGLLMPSFQNSPSQGVGIVNGGWYFPINDFIDLELRGDLYLRGSWAVQATTNYRKRYRYNGNFSYQYRNQRRGLPIFEPFGGYDIQRILEFDGRTVRTQRHIPLENSMPTLICKTQISLRTARILRTYSMVP